MIVQNGEEGKGSLVIQQREHAMLALRFARKWGNGEFSELHPKELMEFVVEHHDEGWNEVDPKLGLNADTGLPYSLIQTPFEHLMETGPGGPSYAEARHPYCGLLVSMHTYGLYNGRYGMSDKVFVKMLPEGKKEVADAMLGQELARQERLRKELSEDAAFSELAGEQELFHNYKLLQFFDTLALYFNCTPESERSPSTFLNVPVKPGVDTEVRIERLGEGVYGLSPYPFSEEPAEFHYDGQRIRPQNDADALQSAMDNTPLERENIRFVAIR